MVAGVGGSLYCRELEVGGKGEVSVVVAGRCGAGVVRGGR